MAATTTIRDLARGCNGKLLVGQLLALAVLLGVMAPYHKQVFSRIAGAVTVTSAEAVAYEDPAAAWRQLVALEDGKLIRTPLRDVTVHKRRGRETGRSYAYYHALVSGNRALLIRSELETQVMPVTGMLEAMPDNVRDRLRGSSALPGNASPLPYILVAEDPATSWGTILTIAACLAIAVLLAFIIRTLMRLADFRRMPAIAALKRFNAPVDDVITAIDADLANGAEVVGGVKAMQLSPNWLFHVQRGKLDVRHLDEVVWAYGSVTTQKLYGFIPVSWSYFVHVADRDGKMLKIPGRKKSIPDALGAIAQRRPWIFAGFSDDLAAAYMHKDHRQSVLAVLEQRREQILAPPSPPDPPQPPFTA